MRTTYLGAHALPPEFGHDPDGYIDAVVEWLPVLRDEGLVDAVDAFCEGIGFTPDQVRRVFDAARALDLPVKLHADQLSDLGGAGIVADFGGLSADHVEHTGEAGAIRRRASPSARPRGPEGAGIPASPPLPRAPSPHPL